MNQQEPKIHGLYMLREFNVKGVHVYGNSLLTNMEAQNKWQVMDEKLITYQSIMKSLIQGFEECQLFHIKG